MRKVLFYISLVIFIGSFSYLIFLSNKWSDGLALEQLNVSGTKYLKDEELTENYKGLIGKRIAEINLKEIELELEESPFVSNVYAQIDHDELFLRVRERFPVCYLFDGDQLAMTSGDLEKMPLRKIDGRTDMPILKGNHPTNKERDAFILFIDKMKSELLWSLSSEILIEEGGIKIVCTEKKIIINFGKLMMMDEKINNFNIFWNFYISGKVDKTFKIIDLRWANRVVLS